MKSCPVPCRHSLSDLSLLSCQCVQPSQNIHQGLPPKAWLARLTLPHTWNNRSFRCTWLLFSPTVFLCCPSGGLVNLDWVFRRRQLLDRLGESRLKMDSWKLTQLWCEPPPGRDEMLVYCGLAGWNWTILKVNKTPASKLSPVTHWIPGKTEWFTRSFTKSHARFCGRIWGSWLSESSLLSPTFLKSK